MIFLTSLSPSHKSAEAQQVAVQSIQKITGSRLISFNHPSEVRIVKRLFPNVEIHETLNTAENLYGKPYVRITAFLDWIKANKDIDIACLINSDIICDSDAEKWKKIEESAKGGTAIIGQRYDFTEYGTILQAHQQRYGIDMFVIHRDHTQFLKDPIYAMGQPFWDYWLPYSLFSNGVRVMKIFKSKLIYHKLHDQQWKDNIWFMLAKHFVTQIGKDANKVNVKNINDAYAYAASIFNVINYNFEEFDLSKQKPDVHTLFRDVLKNTKNPTIFNVGAHKGEDARTFSHIKGSQVYCFEPDPRNVIEKMPKNVVVENIAIGAKNGTAEFHISDYNGDVEWSQSSSLKKPTGHLTTHPTVSFKKEAIEVKVRTLDSYCKERGIKKIDLAHTDVQGAEMDLIIGGKEILKKTRFLYVEYSEQQLYEGQPSLQQILDELKTYSVVADLGTDVLLKNDSII